MIKIETWTDLSVNLTVESKKSQNTPQSGQIKTGRPKLTGGAIAVHGVMHVHLGVDSHGLQLVVDLTSARIVGQGVAQASACMAVD